MLLAIGFLAFAWIDRGEIFQRLSYSVLDSDNWLPYGWSLIAIVLLIVQVRRVGRWRSLWVFRSMLLAATALLFVTMVAGKSGWARYQAYRWECLHQHLGITARSLDETELELVALVTDQAIGRQLLGDEVMLRRVAFERSSLFARRPIEANRALGALLSFGDDINSIESSDNGKAFLLYAIAGGVFDGGSTDSGPDVKNDTIRGLLQERIDSVESLSDNELEALVFCVAHFPLLVDSNQREQVKTAWSLRVPEFSALLAEGYALGEMLHEVLEQNEVSRIRYRLREGYSLPVQAKRRQILVALPRALQTLIQLTSDSPLEFVQEDKSDSDVEFKLSADGGALQTYQRQVYEWRKRYKTGGIMPRTGNRSPYRMGRWVQELEATGETTTTTLYGATIKLEAALDTDPIETTATLAYWQDYLRGDKDDSELESTNHHKLSGRMWPLGIHESYFRGSDAFASSELP